jgi:hypothetical protein
MARRVCRSSSTTKMRRMTHLPRRAGRSMRLVSHPCQKGTAFHTIARAILPCESVHHRISAANRRSVCPLQCIRPVPQPGAAGSEIYSRSQHATGFENAPALNDGSALSNATIVAPARPPSSTRIRAAAERSGAFRNLARHELPRLMQRRRSAARKYVSPGRAALVAPVVAHAGFARRQGAAVDPGIPRTDDRRARTAVSIAAHAFQRARLASYSGGHAAARGRYLAGRSPLYNAAL